MRMTLPEKVSVALFGVAVAVAGLSVAFHKPKNPPAIPVIYNVELLCEGYQRWSALEMSYRVPAMEKLCGATIPGG